MKRWKSTVAAAAFVLAAGTTAQVASADGGKQTTPGNSGAVQEARERGLSGREFGQFVSEQAQQRNQMRKEEQKKAHEMRKEEQKKAHEMRKENKKHSGQQGGKTGGQTGGQQHGGR